MSKQRNKLLIVGTSLIALVIVLILSNVFGLSVTFPLFFVLPGVVHVVKYFVTGEDLENAVVQSVFFFTLAGYLFCLIFRLFVLPGLSLVWGGLLIALSFALITKFIFNGQFGYLVSGVLFIVSFILLFFTSYGSYISLGIGFLIQAVNWFKNR